jgi:hypothetical protein
MIEKNKKYIIKLENQEMEKQNKTEVNLPSIPIKNEDSNKDEIPEFKTKSEIRILAESAVSPMRPAYSPSKKFNEKDAKEESNLIKYLEERNKYLESRIAELESNKDEFMFLISRLQKLISND